MKRRVRSALVLLAGLCLASVGPVQHADQDAIRREWRIRALALDSEPLELGGSDSWTADLAILEALRRRLACGRAEELESRDLVQLHALLESPVPNVRATALACLEFTSSDPWDPATIERLSRDPLPEVRFRLCTAVPASVWEENLAVLSTLTRSEDSEVRRTARTRLYGLDLAGPNGAAIANALEVLQVEVLRQDGVEAYLAEVEQWHRTPKTSFVPLPVGGAAAVFESIDETGGSLRAARALWSAVGGEPQDPKLAAVLAAGWFDPLDPNWSRKSRTQRRLLNDAARRTGDVLAVELLDELAHAPFAKPSIEWDEAREDYFEGLLEAGDASWVLVELAGLGLSDSDLSNFWSLADMSASDWTREGLAPWLAPARAPELRVQVADSLARAFARRASPSARDHLISLLDDEDSEVRELAFEALCDGPLELLDDIEGPLLEAWRGLPKSERLEALTSLPRVRALPAFRFSLLQLGRDASLRRVHPSILELLGKFRGDAACAAKLGGWLAEDIESLASAASEREQRLPEIAARGGVRALHSVAGSAAVTELHTALRLTLDSSMDVAKTAAWCLGRSEEGRTVLRDFLSSAVPTRVRVEAALALTLHPEPQEGGVPVAVLLDRFESCDGELRGRILSALAKNGADAGRDFALELFADPAAAAGLSAQAHAVLLARFERATTDANFALLAECFAVAPSVEARLIAIDGLGQTRDSRAGDLLEAQFTSNSEPLPSEREGLLVALARCAPNSAVLWKALWRGPIDSASVRLAARFRGESSAAIAFSFRGEIEALQLIAEAGAWRPDEEPPLEQLGGRLALALGAACRAGGEEVLASRLERAALVSLAGEFPDEKARFAGLQARARLWSSAEAAGRSFETAFLAEGLHADWVVGEVSSRDLEALFGAFDPTRGVDPLARLTSSALQARARLAAATGNFEEAKRLLEQARGRLGFSRAARKAQQAAERDLR